MPRAEEIIKTALAEVGVTENPPDSNKVKYNNEYYGRNVQGFAYPWCCAFVWWVFSQHSPCLVKKTALCADLADWFKKNCAWHTTPEVGDVVFFKFGTSGRWTNHVGIVTKISGTMIETVEGNTSVSSQDNGGAVMVRQRSSNIVGYGRPAYDTLRESKYQYGIDVNEKQQIIDYTKVKQAGIQFVCIRSTKKSGAADMYFERNYSECVKNRIDYSCFKYAYAKKSEQAVAEARSVIALLGIRKMMIWYDLEDKTLLQLGKGGIEVITEAFMEECRKHGFEVGIYCNWDWYTNIISDRLKNKYLFWIARYGKNNGQLNEEKKPTGKNIFAWQYTSKGSVPGINGDVDLDVIL